MVTATILLMRHEPSLLGSDSPLFHGLDKCYDSSIGILDLLTASYLDEWYQRSSWSPLSSPLSSEKIMESAQTTSSIGWYRHRRRHYRVLFRVALPQSAGSAKFRLSGAFSSHVECTKNSPEASVAQPGVSSCTIISQFLFRTEMTGW